MLVSEFPFPRAGEQCTRHDTSDSILRCKCNQLFSLSEKLEIHSPLTLSTKSRVQSKATPSLNPVMTSLPAFEAVSHTYSAQLVERCTFPIDRLSICKASGFEILHHLQQTFDIGCRDTARYSCIRDIASGPSICCFPT